VKYNMFYTAGVWPTYLFVAGSIILLQCLSMIHKTGKNLRNDEIWRLILLEQIPPFVELDKISIMSNRWKRNKFTWHLLQQGIHLRLTFWKSHALGAELRWFFQSLHMSTCQKASVSKWKLLKKHLLNFMFLVSPNDKRFYS